MMFLNIRVRAFSSSRKAKSNNAAACLSGIGWRRSRQFNVQSVLDIFLPNESPDLRFLFAIYNVNMLIAIRFEDAE